MFVEQTFGDQTRKIVLRKSVVGYYEIVFWKGGSWQGVLCADTSRHKITAVYEYLCMRQNAWEALLPE